MSMNTENFLEKASENIQREILIRPVQLQVPVRCEEQPKKKKKSPWQSKSTTSKKTSSSSTGKTKYRLRHHGERSK